MEKQLYSRIVNEQPAVVARFGAAYRNHRIGHAYIFDGEKGIGKQDAALYFAQLLLCEQPNENVPCGTCSACKRVASGNHPNIHTLQPDGQDIKKTKWQDYSQL